MVPLKSIIVLTLAAVAHLVQSNPIPTSSGLSKLPLCTPSKIESSGLSINYVKDLTYQEGPSPQQPRYYDGDTAVTRRPTHDGHYITTIHTGAITDVNANHIRISWTHNGQAVTRVFNIGPNMTCRVKKSKHYDTLEGAKFIDHK